MTDCPDKLRIQGTSEAKIAFAIRRRPCIGCPGKNAALISYHIDLTLSCSACITEPKQNFCQRTRKKGFLPFRDACAPVSSSGKIVSSLLKRFYLWRKNTRSEQFVEKDPFVVDGWQSNLRIQLDSSALLPCKAAAGDGHNKVQNNLQQNAISRQWNIHRVCKWHFENKFSSFIHLQYRSQRWWWWVLCSSTT